MWCDRWDRIDADDRAAMRADFATWTAPPKIAVLMPVYETNPAFLEAAIASVRDQTYPHWMLAIADDASSSADITRILTRVMAEDHRVRFVRRPTNGGVAAASNTALDLVEADWVALLDHDDLLPPHALYMVARTIREHPDAQIIYSDEDNVDETGRRHSPYFRSDFDLDLLLGQNAISHLGVYRTSAVREVGGFRSAFEGSQDLDLALRVAGRSRPDQIRHVPHVLYHWRKVASGSAFSERQPDRQAVAARAAVEDFLRSKAIAAEVTLSPRPPFVNTRRLPPATLPHVTVIVPTRDRLDLLRPCIDSLLRDTRYVSFDVMIIDNGSVTSEINSHFQAFAGHRQVSIVRDSRPFNYSAIHNRAVLEARGEITAFLNNDTEVIDGDWLTAMVSHAVRPEVGAVGAKLLYPDGTIQHAGVVTGIGGSAQHVFAHSHGLGYFARADLTHAVAAVTGACLVMRKANYLAVGGMNENLGVAYNDVDLCLRLRALGLLIIYSPHAVLIHKESQSRGSDNRPGREADARAELEHLRATWGEFFDNDPYYNPNLTIASLDYGLAEPPRKLLPWRQRLDPN